MGTLKPGATYIYERNGNEVYAREVGADPADRVLVGYGYDPVTGHQISYINEPATADPYTTI